MNKRRAKAEAYRLIAADIEVLKDTLFNKYKYEDAAVIGDALEHQQRVFRTRLHRLGYSPEPEYTGGDEDEWLKRFERG